MNGDVAALAMILGAALLAAWLGTRLPSLSPTSFRGAGLHMLCSILAVEVGMRVLGSAPHDAPAPVMAALFGAALPATVYLLLAAFWLLKLLAGLVQRTSPPGRPH